MTKTYTEIDRAYADVRKIRDMGYGARITVAKSIKVKFYAPKKIVRKL